MTETSGVAAEHLESFMARIERLEEEKKGIAGDIKEIFAEAKGTGFDTKAMKAILKLRAMGPGEAKEQEYMIDLYKVALKMTNESL